MDPWVLCDTWTHGQMWLAVKALERQAREEKAAYERAQLKAKEGRSRGMSSEKVMASIQIRKVTVPAREG